MKIHLLVLMYSLLGLSVVGHSQTSKPSEQFRSPGSTAYTRRSDGAYVTDNRVFEFVNALLDDGDRSTWLLLLKSIHNEHIDGLEETTGRVRVQAWTLGKNGTREKRWNLSSAGNSGQSLHGERFFLVTQWGCCDWPHVNWYFSLLSGKRLYVSNSELLSSSAPEGGPWLARYVAFGYYEHGKPPILQYGSDVKVKQRFSLLSPREYYNAPEVFIKDGEQLAKSLVLQASARFTIVLRYRDGVEIHVPVLNDTIDVDKAELPHGYSWRMEGDPPW